MNQVKSRLAALALLDRALTSTPDEQLAALIEGLSSDLREAFVHLVGVRSEAEAATDPAAVDVAELVSATREACAAGRMDGTLERVGAVLSDVCLTRCIEQLGEHADNPTEDQLRSVLPPLVESHGLGTVRLMLASAVAGEAQASAVCIKLLKKDEVYGLPALEQPTTAPVPASAADDEERAALRERRKADRQRKQAEQRARREQAARSRKR